MSAALREPRYCTKSLIPACQVVQASEGPELNCEYSFKAFLVLPPVKEVCTTCLCFLVVKIFYHDQKLVWAAQIRLTVKIKTSPGERMDVSFFSSQKSSHMSPFFGELGYSSLDVCTIWW